MQAIETALESMRQMLEIDGYTLTVGADESVVTLTVAATEAACSECLIPKDLFATMASDSIVKGDIEFDESQLRIVYPVDLERDA